MQLNSILKLGFPMIAIGLLTLSGCSQQVKVRSIEPAEIDRAASLKRIAVLDFKRDAPGLSGKIETKISQKIIEGKPYFTVINRKNINRVIEEQKLQYSGLLNESNSVELGELLGAQALITGEITSASQSDNRYYEQRYRCADKNCKQLQEYTVGCKSRKINLAANIRVADVTRGDIVYSDSLSKNNTWHHCSDDSNSLPSKSQGLDVLANSLANQFVYKMTPNYRNSEVTLLEDPDIHYNSKQSYLLENSLKFIEANRLDKAESLLSKLFQSTQSKSYVAAYNLGVVKEVQGDYQEAKTYYQIADELQTKPINEINDAVNRIDSVIRKRQQALQQIER